MKKIFIILLVCFTTIILNASQSILTESQSEKKLTKPTVNAPVKPMPSKRTLSPMDDRLSDEDCKNIFYSFFFKFILCSSAEALSDSKRIMARE